MQDKKKAGREVRDPVADFNRSCYLLPDGRDGVPAVAFGAAMVNAASFFPSLTKVLLKQAIFI